MADGLSKPTGENKVVRMEDETTPQERAQIYLEQIRKAIIAQSAVYLHMGYFLIRIKEEQLYKYMGKGGYDTFSQFLAGPELSIAPSTAWALIAIYERYIRKFKFMDRQLQDIPWYKLHLLSSIDPTDKADAEEWIEKARVLGPSDFKLEVNEYKGNKGHDHPIPYPHIYRCKDCGMWRIDVDPKYECHCVEPAR